MEEFRIVKPSPPLAPYVKNYWTLKTLSDTLTLARTIPTGMMSLVFHRGNPLLSIRSGNLHPRVFLSGQEITYDDKQYSGQVDMVCVVFRPAGVRAFFDMPASAARDLDVSAGAMGDKGLSELGRMITDAADDAKCIRLIENFLVRRIRNRDELSLKRIEAALASIGGNQTNVKTLAGAACLSPKQFKRVFSEHVGASPKEFLRIIRFQKALYVLQTRPLTPPAQLAFECGYYDQSHMIKEFKAFSGYTPGEYPARCAPYSDYFS